MLDSNLYCYVQKHLTYQYYRDKISVYVNRHPINHVKLLKVLTMCIMTTYLTQFTALGLYECLGIKFGTLGWV